LREGLTRDLGFLWELDHQVLTWKREGKERAKRVQRDRRYGVEEEEEEEEEEEKKKKKKEKEFDG